MEDKWFVYAEGFHSINTVRSAIADDGRSHVARRTKVRNFNNHQEDLQTFEVPHSIAKSLKTSVSDGGQPWKFRFFRLSTYMEHPTEDDPNKDEKKSRKVEATKRSIKAIQQNKAR